MKLIKQLSLAVVAAVVILCSSCTTESYQTLKQASVAISDVQSLSTTSIGATFTPDATCARYIYAVGLAEDRATFLAGEMSGAQVAYESMDVVFEDLEPDTSYVIYALGYDADQIAGSLASVEVSTSDAVCDVELQYVGVISAGVTMSMSSAIYQVDYALSTPGRSDEFKSGDMADIKTVTEAYSKTVNYFDLEPDTEYAYYYQYYDRSNNVSEVFEIAVTTSNKEYTPYVELEFGDVNIYESSYTFKPNDACGIYYFMVGAADEYSYIFESETGYAGDVYSMMLNWAGEDWGVYYTTGDNAFSLNTLSLYNTTAMEFYVLACDDRGTPRAVQEFVFSTEPGVGTGTAEITSITLDEVTSYSSKVTITPNEHTFATFYSLFTKDSYDSYWVDYPDELVDLILEDYYDQVYYGYDPVWVMGNEPFVYEEAYGLDAGTAYYVVAIPMNGAGLDIEGCMGEITIFEFTTDEI